MRKNLVPMFASSMAALIVGATSAQAQDAGGAVAQSGMSGDIIVTAPRREENLQDVPISITAVSGEALIARGFHVAPALIDAGRRYLQV